MNQKKSDPAPEDLSSRLNQETATIEWHELTKHFARGVVINVDAGMDLVDVAQEMATDNVQQLETWLKEGTVRRASDDDARDWTSREPLFWCVVAAPWVLVQEKKDLASLH